MNDPKTIEEAMEVAKRLAQDVCDAMPEGLGGKPHYEVHGNSVFIVWPDGEITNEIQVGAIH